VIAAWLLLFVPLSNPTSAWSLPSSSPEQQVSSTRTLTGDELLRIGNIHDRQGHFPETLTYYDLALSTYRENKQTHGVAIALVKIAHVYERQGRFRDAYVALQEAIPIFANSSDDLAHARALLVMGRVSARLRHLEEARESLNHAVALFDQLKERHEENEALVQLGLVQVDDGLIDQGLSLLQEARQDARTRQDHSQLLQAVEALGDAYAALDRGNDARRYYDEGLRLAEAERNMTLEAELRLRLAYLDADDGRLTEGIELGTGALFLSRTLQDVATEAAALSLLADLYRRMGRIDEAEESAQRALSIYRGRQIFVHGSR
jgi:tetratricopeptide (TPR) repeat protein